MSIVLEELKQKVRRGLDLFLSPFTLIASKWFWWLRNQHIENFPISREIFRKQGIFPIIDHYYDPLFQEKYLHRSTCDARNLRLDWNIDAQLSLVKNISFREEVQAIPLNANKGYYYENASFGTGDAEFWYGILRYFKPKTIIEVGCGFSTHLTQLALNQNKIESPNYSCHHIGIEPYERPWLEELDVTVYRRRIELIDVKLFDVLESGDILFIDSSHVLRPQGDIVTIFFDILPRLKSGVIVHFHDIFTPYDYPKAWIIDEVRIFGEQYMLESFLMYNEEWEILASLNFLKHNYYDELNSVCPMMTKDREPGSFYIRRR